jgi:hypothetical protein
MKRPVIKVARKGKSVSTALTKELTLDSTKNHLKLVGRYEITLDEEI